MSQKVQIFNNFLEPEVFLEIKKFIMSPRCQWRYVNYIAHKDGRDNDSDGYFVHSFKDCHPKTFEDRYPESPHFPLIVKILDKIKYQNILRIRSSLYPRRDAQKPDPFHVDYNFPHKVYNHSEETRVVMFIDVVRPHLDWKRKIFNNTSYKHILLLVYLKHHTP